MHQLTLLIAFLQQQLEVWGRGADCRPRLPLDTPTRPRHRHTSIGHRRVGVHAPRHERQHRWRRALGIVGFFGCGGGGVIAGGNGSGNGDMGTGGTGTGYRPTPNRSVGTPWRSSPFSSSSYISSES